MLPKRSCSHAAQFIGAKPSHAPTQSIARRRQIIPPVSAHTSKPSLQAHAPTNEAPRNRAIQSPRPPKQIRNLLSRLASSKRFPATITASSSQAFTCAETDTIEPACIEESSLSNVRSEHAGGLFVPLVGPGDCVVQGQVPARRAIAQQRCSASVGATRATAGAHPAKAAHSTRHAVFPSIAF